MPRSRFSLVAICLFGSIVPSDPVVAIVLHCDVRQRVPYAEGRSFPGVGPYDRIIGRVQFAVDPRADANAQIIDLELAPVNSAGQVEFQAEFEILAPVDLSKARGTLLYGVNNRGGPQALEYFNGAADHFLMRNGFMVVWSGWIAELLPGGGRLRLEVPVARDANGPLRGRVRAEMCTNEPTQRMNVATRDSHGAYAPTPRGLETATLTWRLREADPRVPIPHGQWRIKTKKVEVENELRTLPIVELVIPAGFHPGYIYELIYEAEGSLVQGLGLAGIRDLMSFLRYDNGEQNPLAHNGASAAKHTLAWGISQSGRCLRQLLYDGLNVDEQGRIALDGVMPHVAGGGLGFFNHRFASPTRFNTQHQDHDYPCDVFPFTYGPEQDPFTDRREGILDRCRKTRTVPKVMHVQTSGEYWDRSGSLVHTDPQGRRDTEVPPEVRIYAIGGARHGGGNDDHPDSTSNGQLPTNLTDYNPILRGLLLALDQWVRDGTEPPASRYPRIANGTLVGWKERESGWRALPGVRYPEVIQQPSFRDYGDQFLTKRRITQLPPRPQGDYRVLVPANDPDNNERGMLLPPLVAIPVATHTGWNLRAPKVGAQSELLRLSAATIRFPRTAAQRKERGDPRRAVLERYDHFDDYLAQVKAATKRLIEKRYLLEGDFQLYVERAHKNRLLFAR